MKQYKLLLFALFLFTLGACADDNLTSPSGEASLFSTADRAGGGGGGGNSTSGGSTIDPTLAGLLTAGEWNDLAEWPFWNGLMRKDSFFSATGAWGFDPYFRPLPYAPNPLPGSNYQIAFLVDATGSMADEIEYLQSDLASVLQGVRVEHPNYFIETGFVFYRDEGDEYVTRHQNFTPNVSAATAWLSQQGADGGGDYPEAVDEALASGLRDLSWSAAPGSRIAFLLLDAPPHEDANTMARYRASVDEYRQRGIRIIPVAASGVNLETELLLRMTAIQTNGTYTFLTDDSRIGNPHLEPSIGDFEVEFLRDLLIRLIGRYGE